MSDASIAGRRPRALDLRGQVAPPRQASPAKPGFLCRLRTMGRVNLRGMAIDITPVEIQEDLDYGRD